jgi:hypothetical protein
VPCICALPWLFRIQPLYSGGGIMQRRAESTLAERTSLTKVSVLRFFCVGVFSV